MVLLDARGTGRSTPLPPLAGPLDQTAKRLTLYRADAIVRDAELMRGAACNQHLVDAHRRIVEDHPDTIDGIRFSFTP